MLRLLLSVTFAHAAAHLGIVCRAQLPAYLVLLPRLFLTCLVPTLAASASSVDAKRLAAGTAEYFCYSPIRLVGTLEAFYSKITNKPARWGNTGGVKSGSSDELPILIIVVALAAGLARSLFTFLFVNPALEIQDVLPVWAFSLNLLSYFWPFARVSIQEALGWSYASLDGGLLLSSTYLVVVMAFVVFMQARAAS